MNSKTASWFLFLLGTFSMTQIRIIGSIGISELVVFVLAPWVFLIDYKVLKYDGFMPAIWLALLMCLGCVVASIANYTPFLLFLKGLATPYTIFSIL